MTKKAKSLFLKFEIETAKASRTCAHSPKTIIAKGAPCLVFNDGYRRSKSYSAVAVKKMIDQARKELDELEEIFQDHFLS